MTSSQSDSSMLNDILSRRIPALLTRMSREPKVSIAWSTTFLPPAHELMSSPLTAASPPFSSISVTTSSAGCASPPPSPCSPAPTSLTTTLAPSAASRRASSRPMPRPAPVTTATLPSSSPIVMPPCAVSCAGVTVSAGAGRPGRRARRRGAGEPPRGPAVWPMGPAQGQNRARASAVTWPISAAVSPRAWTRPNRAVRLTTSRPAGGATSSDRSAPPAMHRTGSGVPARPGQREHAPGHLAVERGRVEVALAGDDQVGPLHPLGQAHQLGDEVEARLDPRAERDQATGEAPGGAGAGHRRHVDAGLAPVARGDVGQAAPERLHLLGRGALLGPEHRGGIEEGRGHVARHDELDAVQRLGRTHGVERALTAVGRGRPPAADDDAARSRVARRHEELPDARRAGADRVVAVGPRQQGASRRTRHLDDRRGAAGRVQHAPLGLDRRAERAAHHGGVRAPRRVRRAGPRRRRTSGPRRPSIPPRRAAPAAAAAASAADAVPRNLSGAATRWGTGTKLAKGRTR